MPNQEVCEVCFSIGHGTHNCSNTCDSSVVAMEEVKSFQRYHLNTYNHPNHHWKQNNYLAYTQCPTLRSNKNHPYPPSQSFKPTLEDSLNAFIQVSRDNQLMTNQRLNTMEASVKRIESKVGQLAEQMQKKEPGKLPSQPEQAKNVRTLRSGKVINTSLPEISNNLPCSSGNKEGDILVSQKGETSVKLNKPSEKLIGGSSDIPKIQKTTEPHQLQVPFLHRLKESK